MGFTIPFLSFLNKNAIKAINMNKFYRDEH